MKFERIPLKRRDILKLAGAGMVASGASGCTKEEPQVQAPKSIVNESGETVLAWSNWSGNQNCQPTKRLVPKNVEAIQKAVKEAKQPIRMVGSSHSFSGLVPTDSTLMSIARLRGIDNVNKTKTEVDVWAGTRLGRLGKKLWQEGLSMINMPDIDSQMLAGALATSTHGTGKRLGSLSTQVSRFEFVNAQGELVSCSKNENSDLFHAAGNHIGALGVLTKARLRVEPQYYLKEHSWMMSEEEGLARAEELRDKHRHYEMYALPQSNYILGIAIDKVAPEDIPKEKPESGDAYEAFRLMSNVIDYVPFMRSWIVNMGASTVSPETRYGPSNEIFGNLRDIRFNEMEYTVPAEVGPKVLKEILDMIKKKNLPIVFPIEARYIPADEVWLSPFYKRDGFAISCHNFHDKDYKKYFAEVEKIFHKYDGRPHWGKLHSLSAKEFAARYERFEDFKKVRQEMDPNNLFVNDHIRHVLGLS